MLYASSTVSSLNTKSSFANQTSIPSPLFKSVEVKSKTAFFTFAVHCNESNKIIMATSFLWCKYNKLPHISFTSPSSIKHICAQFFIFDGIAVQCNDSPACQSINSGQYRSSIVITVTASIESLE